MPDDLKVTGLHDSRLYEKEGLIGNIRRKRQKDTSCDLEVCATKPPPWKCNTSHGEGGLRFVFRPKERDIEPPSERHSASNFSLS